MGIGKGLDRGCLILKIVPNRGPRILDRQFCEESFRGFAGDKSSLDWRPASFITESVPNGNR